MNYQTEIRGMRFFEGDDGKRPFRQLALAEVALPEMGASINDVLLTWSKAKGWRALPPFRRKEGRAALIWNCHGAFALDLADKLKDVYLAMGGKNPDQPKRVFVPLHALELSEDEGLPLRERIEDALEAESARRGVPCYTEVWERTEPEAADDEAEEGLHRVLGVDPVVSETMTEAGL